MKFIIVKNFTDVMLNPYDSPLLNLEVEGKTYSIINYKNKYYCELSNAYSDSEGIVEINPNTYNDYADIVYKCMEPFLDSNESYMIIDDNGCLFRFISTCKNLYSDNKEVIC